jgi:hypothetical protein
MWLVIGFQGDLYNALRRERVLNGEKSPGVEIQPVDTGEGHAVQNFMPAATTGRGRDHRNAQHIGDIHHFSARRRRDPVGIDRRATL